MAPMTFGLSPAALLLIAHHRNGDQRSDDADGADQQRIEEHGAALGEEDVGEQHGRCRGDAVGLEEVGRHAGAVADVVAHVVGDDGRVARIVLGDVRLDLARRGRRRRRRPW